MGIARRTIGAIASLGALAVLFTLAQSAQASSSAAWLVISQPAPSYFHAGDTTDFYEIVAINDGAAATTGKVTLEDKLPVGVVVTSVAASSGGEDEIYGEAAGMGCTTSGGSPQTVECTTENAVPVSERVIARIEFEVPIGTSGPLNNIATIAGGGAPAEAVTSNSTPIVAASQQVPYGVHLETQATQEDGQPATQAGSHPFAFTTLLAMNVAKVNAEEGDSACGPPNVEGQPGCPELAGAPKNIEVRLPPGFVGDPSAVPRCSQEQFQAGGNDGCPATTQVGGVYLRFYGGATSDQYAPIYDVEPPPGEPAELGFTVGGTVHIPMFFHVRSEGDYGLTTNFTEISTFDAARLVALTIWGVPASEIHNPMRESIVNECEPGAKGGKRGCPSEAVPARPFLTMPSSCSGQALEIPLISDSWQAPGSSVDTNSEASFAALTGCEALSFAPEVEAQLTTDQAGAPAGYVVDLKVPQTEGPQELATPDVRDVEVTLPVGTEISPSAANGLVSCSDAEFGVKSGVEAKCQPASTVGTVKISTPLLAQPLTGEVFVGQPECAPCTPAQAEDGQMVRLFIQAQGSGVFVKLAGHTKVNRTTGQLTTVFTENPQLPFDELELALDDGPGAPLTNPTTCGPAVAVAKLTPWSVSEASTVTAGGVPNIEGCSSPTFTPSLVAGMNGSARAGSFGSFSVTIVRPDGQQDLGAVSLHTPPGLAGMLANVSLCDEAQANAGTCGATSQIGEVTASVGSGPQPYTIHGGRVFLTGPYGGGSFGLSIVVPAEAGPYRLAGLTGSGGEGDGSVVIRGSIKIDPKTAALTVATNPLPTELDGIPLHLQKVVVNVNREKFMFNPTSCDAMSIDGTMTSSAGATSASNYPFQSTDCATLPFKPGFMVSTHAHHTRRNGAYLHVVVTSGSGQANIKSVFVELPKVLPSRTETLQLACSEKQFAENPAGCPAGSRVGTAVAHTPVLPVPLTGPAIFVSHGGAAFPELDVVLQGDGVTVDLAGITNIHKGVTSSDFNAVPDVPVSRFELTLPEKPHSALAATANLCTRTVTKRVKTDSNGKVTFRTRKVKDRRVLSMPTTITGQNGAVVEKITKIAVDGCGRR